MALADWLNPAPPQPTYLTSRAMGVVVPEYFKAASEARQTSLDLAGKEQSLRLSEEEAARQREAERRRAEEERVTAEVMPELQRLDISSPSYFKDVGDILSRPGAANALASQSVRSFLDIYGQSRRESEAVAAEKRAQEAKEKDRRAEEAVAKRRDEQSAARSSQEAALRLAERLAIELEDPGFLKDFQDKLPSVDQPQKTPGQLAQLVGELNKEYSSRKVRRDILQSGGTRKDVEAVFNEGVLDLDAANEKIGILKRQLSESARVSSRIRALTELLDDPTTPRDIKNRYRDELLRLTAPSGADESPAENPAGNYVPPSDGSASRAADKGP